jgi:hypothetical protein
MFSFITDKIIAPLIYPMWLIVDGLTGFAAKTARNLCYWDMGDSWTATATCERVGDTVYNNKAVMMGTIAATGFIYHQTKVMIREREYGIYKNKTKHELQQLNARQIEAFEIGTQAAHSKVAHALSFFQPASLLSPRAYFAGYAATKHEDHALIKRVTNKR